MPQINLCVRIPQCTGPVFALFSKKEVAAIYRALYRKYRPLTFDDVIGQEPIVTTLKNQVETGKLSHAYLFTGSRGTGKTTCSKILAKAINCPNVKDGQPCGVCDICTGIDEDSITDVVELDAASNNGVDNIRALREEANFVPTRCKKRVYIIDEVHMLSPSAFNALLKIMEEPPEHVVFILATTELHKLPVTILSRCQRFDFARITAEQIAGRLAVIAEREGVQLDEDARFLLAKLADGGMRDALSLLDKCASTGERVSLQMVKDLCGVADKSYLFDLFDCLLDRDLGRAIALLDDLFAHSVDMGRLAQELLSHGRDLMLCKVMEDFDTLVLCPPDDRQRYVEQAARIPQGEMMGWMARLMKGADAVGRAASPRIAMEMLLVEITAAADQPVAPQVTAIKVAAVKPSAAPQAKPAPRPAPEPVREEREEEVPLPDAPPPAEGTGWQEPAVLAPASPQIPEAAPQRPAAVAPPVGAAPQPLAEWPQVLEALANHNRLAAAALANSRAYLSGDLVLIASENATFLKMMRENARTKADIRAAVSEVTGKTCRLGPYREPEGEAAPTEGGSQKLDQLIARAQAQGIDVTIKE